MTGPMRSPMSKQILRNRLLRNRQSIDSLLFVGANQVVNSQIISSEKSKGQVFIPITDDIIYDHPEQIRGPLVPYFAGMECQNWLSVELNPDEDIKPNLSEEARCVPKPSLSSKGLSSKAA